MSADSRRTSMTVAVAVVLGALAQAAPAGAAITFAGPTLLPAHTAPESIATGDFNGDGRNDIVAANFGSDDVSVLLGNGPGTFAPTRNYGAHTQPNAVAVGDYNSDGRQDLAVANSGSADVSLLLGSGTGTFAPAVNFANRPSGTPAANPTSIATLGGHDIVMGNGGRHDLSLLRGTTAGTFGPASAFDVGHEITGVATGDFNANGVPDVAVSTIGDAVVLSGTGSSFGTPVHPSVNDPSSIAVGEFNGDGRQDLALTSEVSRHMSVLLGTGAGAF